MNSKERITAALEGGTPDCVPVTLGLSEMVPVRLTTDDYIEFFWKEKIPLWKARVEAEFDHYHSDSFIHIVEGPSPDDPVTELRNVKESKERVSYTSVIRTAKGELTAEYSMGYDSPVSILEPYVKCPEADYEKVLEMLKHPESKDLSEIQEAYEKIGARGHVGFWLPMPMDWWGWLRSTQEMIMDLMDRGELMRKLFAAYEEYAVALTDFVLSNTPLDSVGLGGSNTSMSVVSPALHREYGLEFGKAICEVSHEHGKAVQYHMCGTSRQALPITVEMGVDGLDALESPPTGNVDLAEVKRTFGGDVSLRGNVNSITVMMQGRGEDVEKDVLRCMESAKEGGGYILGVGDQTPYNTPEENMIAFVEAGRKYGKY